MDKKVGICSFHLIGHALKFHSTATLCKPWLNSGDSLLLVFSSSD